MCLLSSLHIHRVAKLVSRTQAEECMQNQFTDPPRYSQLASLPPLSLLALFSLLFLLLAPSFTVLGSICSRRCFVVEHKYFANRRINEHFKFVAC